MRHMQKETRENLLSKPTKFLLEKHEISEFQVNGPFDDFRSPSEWPMDAWANDTETLFTLPEILSLFP